MPINHHLYRDLYKNARMLVILKMIFDLGGSATVVQLANILGVSRDGVSDNMAHLADRNLVTRPHRHGGWFITRLGMEFIKPSAQVLPENQVAMQEKPALNKENPASMQEKPTSMQENPAVPVNSLINYLNIHQIKSKKELINQPAPEKPALPEDVWQAFSELGIQHNSKTDQVSLTPGLTYQGVMKQWQKLTDQGRAWTGMLIKTLPKLSRRELRGHPADCRCADCYAEHQRLLEERHLNPRRRHGEWSDE
jgi:DNA-binding transcriptional MocR family regulator